MPVVQRVASDLEGQVDFYYVAVDEDVDIAQRFDISGVPVLMRWDNGQEAERMIGYQPEEAVHRFAAPE